MTNTVNTNACFDCLLQDCTVFSVLYSTVAEGLTSQKARKKPKTSIRNVQEIYCRRKCTAFITSTFVSPSLAFVAVGVDRDPMGFCCCG